MSTRDCTPHRFDRVTPRDGQERAELPAVDRVALLREGASINRFIGAQADRFLPQISLDQRANAGCVRYEADLRYNADPRIDPRNGGDRRNAPGQIDPRYGADLSFRPALRNDVDPRLDPSFAPRNGGDQRYADPRNGGDQRYADPRNGGDQRYADPRNGGDQRYADPRNGGDQRYADPRNGGDPRYADPRNGGDPRYADPRNDFRIDDPSGGDRSGSQMQDHTVRSGDSLWKIARRALKESGEPASARDIMTAIQGIVDANKAEHPSLASNPNLIKDGWNLKIPIGGGQDGNRDGRSQDLYQFDGNQRRRSTGYDGSDAYFDQRQQNDRGDSSGYGQGSGEFRGRRHSRGDQSGREYGADPYRQQENPYNRRQQQENPYDRRPQYENNPDVQPNNGPISGLSMALKDAALLAARGMGTIGRCAAGVQVALARIGHGQFMGAGNAWDMGGKMARSGKFDQLPMSQAREGDIIVRSWNRSVIAQHGGKNWGDIVVVTAKDARGGLMGANDHTGRIAPDGGRYENSYVLRCRA